MSTPARSQCTLGRPDGVPGPVHLLDRPLPRNPSPVCLLVLECFHISPDLCRVYFPFTDSSFICLGIVCFSFPTLCLIFLLSSPLSLYQSFLSISLSFLSLYLSPSSISLFVPLSHFSLSSSPLSLTSMLYDCIHTVFSLTAVVSKYLGFFYFSDCVSVHLESFAPISHLYTVT